MRLSLSLSLSQVVFGVVQKQTEEAEFERHDCRATAKPKTGKLSICGCILFDRGPDANNTEGLKSALARFRHRTGPSSQPPSSPPSPSPTSSPIHLASTSPPSSSSSQSPIAAAVGPASIRTSPSVSLSRRSSQRAAAAAAVVVGVTVSTSAVTFTSSAHPTPTTTGRRRASSTSHASSASSGPPPHNVQCHVSVNREHTYSHVSAARHVATNCERILCLYMSSCMFFSYFLTSIVLARRIWNA